MRKAIFAAVFSLAACSNTGEQQFALEPFISGSEIVLVNTGNSACASALVLDMVEPTKEAKFRNIAVGDTVHTGFNPANTFAITVTEFTGDHSEARSFSKLGDVYIAGNEDEIREAAIKKHIEGNRK